MSEGSLATPQGGRDHASPRPASAKPQMGTAPNAARLHPLHQLQRDFGNRAVLRLLRSHAIQIKLTVGRVDDPLEHEADRVADQVMRMAEPVLIGPSSAAVQRKCTGCEDEDKKTIRTQRDSPMNADAALDADAAERVAARSGTPLSTELRSYFENRFGRDFSGVKVHADSEAASSARGVQARAYTLGNDIVFGAGEYAPETAQGKRLIAHELAHVVQQQNVAASAMNVSRALALSMAASALVQRAPETWYRGEAEGVAPAQPGGHLHDFGDGLYLADDPALAAQYANVRAGENPTAGRVVAATFERTLLGRVLNLSTDPRWAAYMRETIPSGSTHEQLIHMANENYSRFFQEFLRRNGMVLDDFDCIIGPEYVRGGNQICIRNSGIAAQVRAMLGPLGTGSQPAQAPAEYPVESRFRLLNTEEIPGGRIVSDVEVVLGDGLDAINARVTASGGKALPGRFTLRITTDPNGAFVAAETSASEAAGLAETLARQALLTAPEVGASGTTSGAAGAARGVSPWVRGASWAGIALFAAIMIYRYQTAAPRDRPRVLARAGGGFTAGMAGGYVVCNLVLGIETLGWSLLICGALVGIPAGMAGEALADVAYEEATIDDDEIREWVASHDLGGIGRLPAREKSRMIFSLMHGWISDEDVASIVRILDSVESAAEMAALRRAIEPHITEMSSIGQRTHVRIAMARRL